jgi:drug/metabolite transporter (DMT)-like permease
MKILFKNTAFLAIISCVLWSSAFSVIKIGLEYSPPLQFAGIRFIIAGLMLLPFSFRNGTLKKNLWGNKGIILKVAFFQTFIQYTLFYSGMKHVPAALGAIIHGAGPLFAALVAHYMMQNDKLNLRKMIIIFLGITGVTLVGISRGSIVAGGPAIFAGIALLLLSNLNAGFANVLVARDAGRIPPVITSSISMLTGGIMLLLVSIPAEGLVFSVPPPMYFVSLGWLSFLSAAALTIWFGLLQREGVKVSSLNMWKFVIPVSGAILSWILIPEEKPDLLTTAGMVITAAALIMLYRDGSKQMLLSNPQ